jgi:hypothetical protein
MNVIKSRRMSWAERGALIGQIKNAYKILVGDPDGDSSLGRSRRRWELILE